MAKTATATRHEGVGTVRAPSPPEPRVPSSTRPAGLGWAAVVAACAAAAALAFVTLRGADDDRMPDTTPVVGAHQGINERGSIRAIEGSVEDSLPVRDPATLETMPDTRPAPGAHSGLADRGSIRAIEGSVEDTAP
jgi:hypothetical protein